MQVTMAQGLFFMKKDKDKDEPYTDGLEAISPDYTVISGCDCDDKVKRIGRPMMMLLHYMKNIPAVTEAFILQVKMETLYSS